MSNLEIWSLNKCSEYNCVRQYKLCTKTTTKLIFISCMQSHNCFPMHQKYSHYLHPLCLDSSDCVSLSLRLPKSSIRFRNSCLLCETTNSDENQSMSKIGDRQSSMGFCKPQRQSKHEERLVYLIVLERNSLQTDTQKHHSHRCLVDSEPERQTKSTMNYTYRISTAKPIN